MLTAAGEANEVAPRRKGIMYFALDLSSGVQFLFSNAAYASENPRTKIDWARYSLLANVVVSN